MRATAALLLPLIGGCIPGGGSAGRYEPRYEERAPEPAPRDYEPQRLDDGVTAPPAAKPAWESRPVTADATEVAGGDYSVVAGDTLRGIAAKTGAGSEAIARANGLSAPFIIQPGQRLTIPGGRYHLVRAGETGIAIARAYGVEWSRIVTANALEEPYVLRVGQRVIVPGSDRRPATPAERAAAFRLDIEDLVTGAEPAIREDQRPARAVAGVGRVLAPTTPVAQPARLRTNFAWPVEGQVVGRFGRGASGVRNDGIKIAVPVDTPILAAADGTVAYVGSGIAALGGLVIVKHGDGWSSVYGHASQLLVQRGQAVKRGQRIALSGDTGFADRPELHFELRKGRTAVDPQQQLPRR